MSFCIRSDAFPRRTIGVWHVIIDKNQDRNERAWNSLCTLHVKAPDLFCKPPKRKLKELSSLILCYTFSCSDETRIRQSAEFIRKSVSLPYSVNFFSQDMNPGGLNEILFVHTPEGELYKKTDHSLEVVYPNPSVNSCTVDVIPPEVINKECIYRPTDIIPSEVINKECIYLPSTEEGIANMTNGKGGKWMVFSKSMASHDARWLTLVSLYRKGILIGLKASTSVLSPTLSCGFKKTDPVILCYTANAEDKQDVLRAADAIRNALGNKFILFYKTNSASNSGLYRHEGKKQVSKYQHTVQGGLYERDFLNRYGLVIPSCKRELTITG